LERPPLSGRGLCIPQRPPTPHLLIVGDGPQRAALDQLVAAKGIGRRVTFAGNQADVVPWLQAIDVLRLPSYANEGVPQAILQAFACGLPVVTTAAGRHRRGGRADGTPRWSSRWKMRPPLRARSGACSTTPAWPRGSRGAPMRCAQARFGLDAMLDRMEDVFRAAIGRREP
jgi:hypothetical protein